MPFDLSFEGLLIAFALLVAATIALMALAIGFQRGVNNMPLVARHAGLAERIDERRQSLADIDKQIADRQITLTERDMAKAEIEAQQQLLARLRQEIDGLDAGRAEVEQLNAEINEAVVQRAEATRALDEKQTELAAVADRAEAAERRAIRREGEIDALEAREKALRAATEAAQVDLEQAQARRAEADGLARRVEELQAEAVALDATIAARKAALAQVEHAIARIADDAAKGETLREEVAALTRQRTTARESLDDLAARGRKAEARLAQIEAEIAKGAAPADGRDVLAELRKPPACLRSNEQVGFSTLSDEAQALEQVQERLRALGLTFEDRVLKAFHTSLKISDASPLAVLAGISGTGKSQLPRRYAEAMGINFLQVAVQPRWDSPQDLLGFYNYIEGGYRPTELSQAMLHLDMFNAPEQAGPYDGQMLLVLLDEMNLARVEYYFSEFLSRLEARPRAEAEGDPEQRRAAEIVIDAPMADQKLQRIYPGHNILFVGTMNEDESTQALSEKVLDRANVLHFSRPHRFATAAETTAPASSAHRLRHDAWRAWIRGSETLTSNHEGRTREIIGRLATVMAGCGRPFGHRLNRAMTLYVANHPDTAQDGPDAALVDQIETRILPRLRGVDLEASREPLLILRGLTQDLRDMPLAEAIEATIERGASTNLFSFRGREETLL